MPKRRRSRPRHTLMVNRIPGDATTAGGCHHTEPVGAGDAMIRYETRPNAGATGGVGARAAAAALVLLACVAASPASAGATPLATPTPSANSTSSAQPATVTDTPTATPPTVITVGDKECPGYGGQLFATGTPCPPPPRAAVSVGSSWCVGTHTTVRLTVHGAVAEATYALYGTSGYVASDEFHATGESFIISVQINHGYLGFTGDLESRSIGQVSNPFSIPDRCVVIDRLPPNSPIVSPTTARASTPIRAVTHTEILTNTDTPTSSTEQATDTSTSSAAVIAPVAAAAARHTQSSGATPIIIGIAAVMVIAILAGGTVIARRRSH
jgi:hypothetical protein